MTSIVKIVFTTPKDFEVTINSIESMSPRGMELAFARVEKVFLEQKGLLVKSSKDAAKKAMDKASEEVKEAEELEQAMREELNEFRAKAVEAAKRKLEKKKKADRKALADGAMLDAELRERKAVLDVVSAKVAAVRESQGDKTTPEEVADAILEEVVDIPGKLNDVNDEIAQGEKELGRVSDPDE